MNNYSQLLLRFSALFAVIGVLLGTHMAGSGSNAFRPIHTHILVGGWLTIFAWALYYKVFYPKVNMLAKLHVWSAIIGSIGLSVGMWLQYLKPFHLPDIFVLIFYIGGGMVLLISFTMFFLLTILYGEKRCID
ncbi:hypothetical protein ACFFIS_06840 [Virgibacillus soli]|uniref:Cbb3-type cytochrome c oxidase subunit I n=1 Tax=Paracerasibacillus soli TaxID=480284 RepID=A0ABU5CMT5_9BACI|nr:hypothetical protein [Virgibacillus soli]MDY0407673.1 hypothetical protein [Virgibacillus soli]